MTYLPVFHPQIETDVREVMAHYRMRSPGLDERFKRAFYASVDAILVFPGQNAVKVNAVIRTRLIRPFPYLVFYVLENDRVSFLTVQYAGRKPAYLNAIARERRTS